MTEPTSEQTERLMVAMRDQAARDRVRFRIGATARYCPDDDARPGDTWCVEVGHSDSEAELQGWGPDPLAAALACAEQTFAVLALARGDFDQDDVRAIVEDVAEGARSVVEAPLPPPAPGPRCLYRAGNFRCTLESGHEFGDHPDHDFDAAKQ